MAIKLLEPITGKALAQDAYSQKPEYDRLQVIIDGIEQSNTGQTKADLSPSAFARIRRLKAEQKHTRWGQLQTYFAIRRKAYETAYGPGSYPYLYDKEDERDGTQIFFVEESTTIGRNIIGGFRTIFSEEGEEYRLRFESDDKISKGQKTTADLFMHMNFANERGDTQREKVQSYLKRIKYGELGAYALEPDQYQNKGIGTQIRRILFETHRKSGIDGEKFFIAECTPASLKPLLRAARDTSMPCIVRTDAVTVIETPNAKPVPRTLVMLSHNQEFIDRVTDNLPKDCWKTPKEYLDTFKKAEEYIQEKLKAEEEGGALEGATEAAGRESMSELGMDLNERWQIYFPNLDKEGKGLPPLVIPPEFLKRSNEINLPAVIKAIRGERSEARLAHDIEDITERTVRGWESGSKRPPEKFIHRIMALKYCTPLQRRILAETLPKRAEAHYDPEHFRLTTGMMDHAAVIQEIMAVKGLDIELTAWITNITHSRIRSWIHEGGRMGWRDINKLKARFPDYTAVLDAVHLETPIERDERWRHANVSKYRWAGSLFAAMRTEEDIAQNKIGDPGDVNLAETGQITMTRTLVAKLITAIEEKKRTEGMSETHLAEMVAGLWAELEPERLQSNEEIEKRRKERTPPRIGAAIRQVRKEAGLSQEEAASRAGISQPDLSDYETGDKDRPVTAEIVFQLVTAWGITGIVTHDDAMEYIFQRLGRAEKTTQAEEERDPEAEQYASVVGAVLKRLRKERSLNQTQAAGSVGFRPRYAKYEKGTQTPPPEEVLRILHNMGITEMQTSQGVTEIRTPQDAVRFILFRAQSTVVGAQGDTGIGAFATEGELIYQLRVRSGLTQPEAAAAAGMEQKRWSSYETGTTAHVPAEAKLQILRASGVADVTTTEEAEAYFSSHIENTVTEQERKMEQFGSVVGPAVRRLREEKKLSQTDLSGPVGVSQTLIGQYERGTTTVTPGIALSLVNGLGITDVRTPEQAVEFILSYAAASSRSILEGVLERFRGAQAQGAVELYERYEQRPEQFASQVGPALGRLRRELGLSQTQLAERIDGSQAAISVYEDSETPVPAELLLQLINGMGITEIRTPKEAVEFIFSYTTASSKSILEGVLERFQEENARRLETRYRAAAMRENHRWASRFSNDGGEQSPWPPRGGRA